MVLNPNVNRVHEPRPCELLRILVARQLRGEDTVAVCIQDSETRRPFGQFADPVVAVAAFLECLRAHCCHVHGRQACLFHLSLVVQNIND